MHDEAQPTFRVGNLITLTKDDYPSLGRFYVQLWSADNVVARVYGNDIDEIDRRLAVLGFKRPDWQHTEAS